MEQYYMHMKGQGRGPGTSKDLKVMVKLHMIPVDMIIIAKKFRAFTTCLIPRSFNNVDAWLD